MRAEGNAEDARWRERGAQQRRDRARRHIYSMGADTLIDFQYSIRVSWSAGERGPYIVVWHDGMHAHVGKRVCAPAI